jgi:hypothetical protein
MVDLVIAPTLPSPLPNNLIQLSLCSDTEAGDRRPTSPTTKTTTTTGERILLLFQRRLLYSLSSFLAFSRPFAYLFSTHSSFSIPLTSFICSLLQNGAWNLKPIESDKVFQYTEIALLIVYGCLLYLNAAEIKEKRFDTKKKGKKRKEKCKKEDFKTSKVKRRNISNQYITPKLKY